MFIIMELQGEYVQAERSTSNGRIDLFTDIILCELFVKNAFSFG